MNYAYRMAALTRAELIEGLRTRLLILRTPDTQLDATCRLLFNTQLDAACRLLFNELKRRDATS